MNMPLFNETETAQRIRDGLMPSPTKLMNFWLVAIRITGTGLAYRNGLKEHVWRDPKFYLNQNFLNRCNGLPVIILHPESGNAITEDDFSKRIAGMVVLPYIKGGEVWAICRIYNEALINAINAGAVSTSPTIIFLGDTGTDIKNVVDGEDFLIESAPYLIDHVAMVPLGVWDKGDVPRGVEVTEKTEEQKIAEIAAAVTKSVSVPIIEQLDSLNQRLDAYEQAISEGEEQ